MAKTIGLVFSEEQKTKEAKKAEEQKGEEEKKK